MRQSIVQRAIMAMVLLALGSWAQAQVTYRIEQVGPDPNPPDVYFYFANDLNDKGEVIGGAYATGPFWAWLWRDGELIRLPALPNSSDSDYVDASGLNDRTQIVGSSGSSAVLWQRRQVRDLSTLLGPNAGVTDLNNLGMMIGDVVTNGVGAPMVQWGKHRLMLETLPGAVFTQAVRINELGVVSGYTTFNYVQNHAVIWTLGHIRDLGVLPGGYDATAGGINDRGEVTVTVRFNDGSSSRPAVWRRDHLVELPLPHYGDYVRGSANSINNAGTVVGSFFDGLTGEATALVWQHGAVYNLNDLIRADDPLRLSAQLQQAATINNRGQILALGAGNRNLLLTPSGHL
ncbi:MAG: hypothetical protein WDO56_15090 [Gammaproteobacteria bacterium]